MSERRLRSKDERIGRARVLDFDSQNPWVYKNKPIKVTRGSTVANPYCYPADEPASSLPAAKPQTIIPATLEPPQVDYDPLTDGNYERFHRKMMLFEKVRHNEDRLRMLNECLVLEEQLNQLLREDWGRHIHDIVYIRNRSDANEVSFKRDLAIREVMRLLGKFSHWKHRVNRLTAEVKAGDGWPGTFNDEDHYQRSPEEIKDIETRRWAQEFGGRFRLRLDRNHTVIVDPVKPPVMVNRANQVVGPAKRQFEDFTWTPAPVAVATPKLKRVRVETPRRLVKRAVANTRLVVTNGTAPVALLSRPVADNNSSPAQPRTFNVTLPVCLPQPTRELSGSVAGWDQLRLYPAEYQLPPALCQLRRHRFKLHHGTKHTKPKSR